MSNGRTLFSIALLACWAAQPAWSQEPSLGSPPKPALSRVTFDRVLVDSVEGVVWARGSDYKASFSEKGVSFIPYLGASAPRNFPVAMAVERVSAGGHEVEIVRSRPAVRKGSNVSIDRGSMVEIYDLALGHVEQLFRFDRPVGAGDVVVRLSVETELLMAASDRGGVEFSNQLGGVRYGKAVVVDAKGRHAEIATEIEDRALELVVPAAFLESAAYPVTIDPIFVSFAYPLAQISGSASAMFINADSAYDVATNRFMISYESVYSATDHDVYVMSYYAGQTPLPTSATATIDFTGTNWANPKIAQSGSGPQFLVVAERTLSGGAIVIGGRSVAAATFATSAQFQISSGEVGQKANPDIGGDPISGYCVVWQNTPPSSPTHVYFRLVSSAGTLGTSNILGIVSGLYNDSHPSISKSNRHDGSAAYQDWMVVFQRTAGSGNEDIWGSMIHWDGTVMNDGFPIDTSALSHTLPQVSTQGDYGAGVRRFVAVYEEHTGTPPFGIIDTDIMGAVLDGMMVISGPVNLTTMLVAPANDDQFTPSIDGDGTRFAVSFTQKGSAFASDQGKPYIACLHLAAATNLGVTELPALLSTNLGSDDAIQVASSWSGGGGQYEYLPAWNCLSTSGTTSALDAALYYGWSAAIAGGYYNYALSGCGGLSIAMTGYPILNQPISVQLVGYVGTPYLAYGVSVPPITLCTGCLLGIDPNTAVIFQTDFLAGIVPPEGGLVNTQIAVQGADLGSPNGCPGTPPLTLSDEVIITIL